MFPVCDRITHPGVFYIFDAGGNVTNHSGCQFITWDKLTCAKVSHFYNISGSSSRHHFDRCSHFYRSFFDPAKYDNAFVGIVQGIEDQCLQRCFRISRRRRDLLYDLFQYLINIQTRLGRDQRRILGFNADHIFDLFNNTLRLGAWKVDLIDNRHDIQIMIQCQIHICQCLRFHTLCRIYDKNRSVTGCKASGHFIVEIHMTRRIDQVEDIFFTIFRIINDTNGLRFDRDSTFPLQIHIIKHLRLHLAASQQSRLLDNTVCQCGFAVVYMCNNAEIADFTLIYHSAVFPLLFSLFIVTHLSHNLQILIFIITTYLNTLYHEHNIPRL